jgi:HAE1 family hydrophobic/amphiphilic exporter-1
MNRANVRARRAAERNVVRGLVCALSGFTALLAAGSPPAQAGPAVNEEQAANNAPARTAFLTVVTCYPGLNPVRVEQLLTSPIERALAELPGLASSASKSIEGVSMVQLLLHPETDTALALAQTNALVLAALPSLPPGCPPPLVELRRRGDARAVGLVAVQNPALHEAELGDLGERIVRPGLARMNGIRAPIALGVGARQIRVFVDRARLEARAR